MSRPEKEAEPEKGHVRELEITELAGSRATSATRLSDSGGRRSERIKKSVNRFDPSLTPRTSRKPKNKSRPSLPTALRKTGSRILGTMSSIAQTVQQGRNEAWEKRPLGPPRHPRSESRTSTRTRAASLEKLQRTGSIKINQSIISKSGYIVESRRSRSESSSRSRAGSRDKWE